MERKGEGKMNRVEKTLALQRDGGLNCSQAILTVYGEPFGIDQASARVLGRPWGGGLGAWPGPAVILSERLS